MKILDTRGRAGFAGWDGFWYHLRVLSAGVAGRWVAPLFRFFPLFGSLWFYVHGMMVKVALTGGIACGKSMAERAFARLGCRVLDADAVTRELEGPGGAAVEGIVARFGAGVRAADGGIDRARLGALVFADAGARRDLEAIVLPLVRERVRAWLAGARAGEISVFSAATLFEQGWERGWDGVVCVWASVGTQVRRMMAARGMDEAAARARLAAQMDAGEKARRADWVLRNDVDDPEALAGQVSALVGQWRRGGAGQ